MLCYQTLALLEALNKQQNYLKIPKCIWNVVGKSLYQNGTWFQYVYTSRQRPVKTLAFHRFMPELKLSNFTITLWNVFVITPLVPGLCSQTFGPMLIAFYFSLLFSLFFSSGSKNCRLVANFWAQFINIYPSRIMTCHISLLKERYNRVILSIQLLADDKCACLNDSTEVWKHLLARILQTVT